MATIEAPELKPETKARSQSKDEAQPKVTRPRLLLIEDDKDLNEGLSIWLRHLGFQVSSTWEGVAGLRAIEELEPNLVILDLSLPGMHGFKILYEMRMRRLTQPVIVLTASQDSQSSFRAKRLGASVVLTKPADPHLIAETVEQLL